MHPKCWLKRMKEKYYLENDPSYRNNNRMMKIVIFILCFHLVALWEYDTELKGNNVRDMGRIFYKDISPTENAPVWQGRHVRLWPQDRVKIGECSNSGLREQLTIHYVDMQAVTFLFDNAEATCIILLLLPLSFLMWFYFPYCVW